MFYVSILAETNRAPFDLPEAEAELVAGYNVEYSAMGFALFFLGEYANMILMCSLATILFFGGWSSPIPNFANGAVLGTVWLLSKSLLLVFIQMWVRWTLPRLRVDQLMSLSWKYLTPISILMLFVCSFWKLWTIG